MSTRQNIGPYKVITDGNMASVTVTSLVTLVPKISMLSYSYSWSGSSPVGTVGAQVSNDYAVDAQGNVSNVGTWNTLAFIDNTGAVVTSFAVSGNTGNGGLDITQTGFYAIRTVYTKGSGTGTLQVTICGKVA